jgi:hypothetical protein
VAGRSGATAFRAAGSFQKRRGASLPAAVQNLWLKKWLSSVKSADKKNTPAFTGVLEKNKLRSF